MKIYFAGSIRGGRVDASTYQSMIRFLSLHGEVLTEHVGDTSLTDAGEDGPNDRYIFDRDLAWLIQSDVVVAEVSVPSLGVGFEIGYAVALEMPVLCLYQSKSANRLSAMIAGCPRVVVGEYSSLSEATAKMEAFLKERGQAISR